MRSVAAQPAFIEVAPVSESTAEIARGLGLDPPRDRGRFLSEFVRVLYSGPESRQVALDALRRASADRRAAERTEAIRVPVPLAPAVWSAAVFKRAGDVRQSSWPRISPTAGRRSSATASPVWTIETLEYLAAHPTLLTQLYERSAGGVRRVRRQPSHRRRAGGGARGRTGGAALGGGRRRAASPRRTASCRCCSASRPGAWRISSTPWPRSIAPNAAFALGLWMTDPAVRLERFKALASRHDS